MDTGRDSSALTDLLGRLQPADAEAMAHARQRQAQLETAALDEADQVEGAIVYGVAIPGADGKADFDRPNPESFRHFETQIGKLRDLGIERVRLLTNNPAKVRELIEHGIDVVETVPLVAGRTVQNASYLRTKRDRMGHDLPQVAQWDAQHEGELGK